jgi:hypothetical protein
MPSTPGLKPTCDVDASTEDFDDDDEDDDEGDGGVA